LKRILVFLFFWPLLSLGAADLNIQNCLNAGDFEGAFNLLLRSPDTLLDDEETLYLLGITAPSGKTSSAYLKEYMQMYPKGEHIELVRQHLLNYYSAQGLNITAGRIYGDLPDTSGIESKDLYRVALTKQDAGEYREAIAYYRAIVETRQGSIVEWARLGICDCNLLSGDTDTAISGYKKLIENSQSPSYPMSLLGISEAYRRLGNIDKAEGYYKRYQETFPGAPPSLEIEAAFTESHSKDIVEQIPKSIKAGFFVQVGVFSKKDNARICSRKFKILGYSNKIDEFNEEGQEFYRVILGPYGDEISARKVKTELEKSQREEFLIFVQ
jgi:tetratricopeptide (TPR) repeat protein